MKKQHKYFMVIIIKCSFPDEYWYASRVGEVFKVFEPYENSCGYECASNGYTILKTDSEIINVN